MVDWKKIALFAGGTLFGTAGVKILASDDAKKVYTQCTAAVLRAKDCVMKTVTTVQENAGDIYEDAKTINEERAASFAAARSSLIVFASMKMQRRSMKNVQQQKRQQLLRTQRKQRKL